MVRTLCDLTLRWLWFSDSKRTKRGHRSSNWDARVVRKEKRVQNVPEKRVVWRNIIFTNISWFISFPSLTFWVHISSLFLFKYRNKHIYVCVCVCVYVCVSVQCYGKTWMNILANPIYVFCLYYVYNINTHTHLHKFIYIWLDSDLFYIWFILCMKIKYMIMSKSYILKLKY